MIIQNELIASLRNNGNKIAIEFATRVLTYSELFAKTNKITNYLIGLALPNETIIGIRLTDKIDLISSIIGVINTRCVFVLIDPMLPEGRLDVLLKDLNLNYMLTSADLKESDLKSKYPSLKLIDIEGIMEINQPTNLNYPDFQPNDGLYIYYTSGSTGKPKGILGKNSSLLQFVKWEIKEFEINGAFRVSQLISPYFDAFLRDIFTPLVAGGTICIPPVEEDFFNPEKLISWVEESRVNLIHCVPSIFRLLNHETKNNRKFAVLKYVLLSGEKIIPAELEKWYNHFGDRVQLVNLYGLTETTMVRSCYRIKPADCQLEKIPIGQPIDDTTFLVADENLKPCGKLIPGELYIISKYTAKGYLNDAELTEKRFLRYAGSDDPEMIAFKTGDTARLLIDGSIDLIGRKDRQIKRNGIRIDLDEIEYALSKNEFVKGVAVVYREYENGSNSLLAFVIENKKQARFNLISFLEFYLKDQLPAYMIPDQLHEVTEFPLLQTGKVNHKALLNSIESVEIIIPADELEAKILVIWKEILGEHKAISTENSFLKIGGNSLGMMRLIGKIYNEFKVRITLNQLFNNLTIVKQAVLIKAANRDAIYEIKTTSLKSVYALSSAQKSIYYNYELDKTSINFNMPIVFKIDKNITLQKIESLLQTLINRHESLRTHFSIFDGQMGQVINEDISFKIKEISGSLSAIDDLINGFISPFDLNSGPLIRCGLINCDHEARFIVIDLHHSICDGFSQIILFSEFITLYRSGELKPLKVQYKDYSEWESEFRKTDEFISHRQFWLSSFENDIPKLTLPILNMDLGNLSDEGSSIDFKISRTTLIPLFKAFENSETTTFSILFSLFFVYLTQLTGQEDIIVGTVTSGRTQEEVNDVVGMFVRTLPIRYKLDTNLSFKEFSDRFHKYLVEANSKQFYDVVDIVSEINKKNTKSIDRIFDVMFVFQNFIHQNSSSDNDLFSIYKYEKKTSKYPLTLTSAENGEHFDFRFEYSTVCFTEEDIKLLISQFIGLTELISTKPHLSISELIEDTDTSSSLLNSDFTFNL